MPEPVINPGVVVLQQQLSATQVERELEKRTAFSNVPQGYSAVLYSVQGEENNKVLVMTERITSWNAPDNGFAGYPVSGCVLLAKNTY